MPKQIYYQGQSGVSFDEIMPQGLPTIENPDSDNIDITTIRQIYMCRLGAYRRAASGSYCPREIGGGIRAVFLADNPRTPTGIADIVIFERIWST